MATTFKLKRKTFAFPTFGLKNLGNAFGMTKASEAMTGAKRLGEFSKGTLKAGATIGTGAAIKGGADLLTGEGAAKQN